MGGKRRFYLHTVEVAGSNPASPSTDFGVTPGPAWPSESLQIFSPSSAMIRSCLIRERIGRGIFEQIPVRRVDRSGGPSEGARHQRQLIHRASRTTDHGVVPAVGVDGVSGAQTEGLVGAVVVELPVQTEARGVAEPIVVDLLIWGFDEAPLILSADGVSMRWDRRPVAGWCYGLADEKPIPGCIVRPAYKAHGTRPFGPSPRSLAHVRRPDDLSGMRACRRR